MSTWITKFSSIIQARFLFVFISFSVTRSPQADGPGLLEFVMKYPPTLPDRRGVFLQGGAPPVMFVGL